MNTTITPELGQQMRAAESVIPAAADALADLEKARRAEAAAHAKVSAIVALEQQWQNLLERIEKLKSYIAAIEYLIPEFKVKTDELLQHVFERVGDCGIGFYQQKLDDLIRRERVAAMLPKVLEQKRAELSAALTEAVKFAGSHKIPRAELPEGAPPAKGS
jgi:vacuolar-type H+-ATPase subunit D/Vma8